MDNAQVQELIDRAEQDKKLLQEESNHSPENEQLSSSASNQTQREAIQQQIDDLSSDQDDSLQLSWLNAGGKRLLSRFGLFILFFFGINILSILWGYHFSALDKEVSTLESKREDIKYKSLFTTAELIGQERVSSVEKTIKELGLSLEASTYPPYEVEAPATESE